MVILIFLAFFWPLKHLHLPLNTYIFAPKHFTGTLLPTTSNYGVLVAPYFFHWLAHREHLFHWPAHIENNTIPTSTANSSLRSLALYYPARARSHLRASGRHACRTPGLRRPCSRAGRPRGPIITCQWSAGSAASPPPRGRPSWRFFPVFPLFCSKVSIVSHGRAKARKC